MPSDRISVCTAALLALALAGCAPSVETVLERNLEAMGGRPAIRAVKSLKFVGEQKVGEGTIGVSGWWKAPNRLRLDFDSGGLVGSQAYDGEHGWALMPFNGDFRPHPLEGEALADLAAQADMLEGPTFDLATKGTRALLLARESYAGVPAWKVEITDVRQKKSLHWFDAETWLELGNRQHRKSGGEAEVDVDTRLSDYRRVGPLLFAFRSEESTEGAVLPAVFTLRSIELDVDVPDSLWEIPPSPELPPELLEQLPPA